MGKGDVIIGIDLEVDGLKESREVTKTFTELTKDVKSTDTELSSLEKEGQKWVKTLDEIRRKSSRGVATKEYLDLRNIVNGLDADTKKYSAELDSLNEKLSKTDPNKNADRYQKLQDEIAKTSAKLKQARSDYAEYKVFFEEFAKTTEAYKPFDTRQVEDWNLSAEKAKNKLSDINEQIRSIRQSREEAQITPATSDVERVAEETKKRIDEMSFAITDFVSKTDPLVDGVYKVTNAFEALKNGSDFKVAEQDIEDFVRAIKAIDPNKPGFGGFQSQVEALQEQLESLKGKIPDKDFEYFQGRLSAVVGELSSAKTFIGSLADESGKLSAPLQEIIDKWTELQDALGEKRHINYDELIKTGDSKSLQQYNELIDIIRTAYRELSTYIEFQNIEINTNEADANSILKMEQELARLVKVRDAYRKAKTGSTEDSQQYAQTLLDIERLTVAINDYYANVKKAARSGGTIADSISPLTKFGNALKQNLVSGANKARKALETLGSAAKKSVGNIFNKLSSSLKSVASNFRKSSGGADELHKKLKHGWTAIMKYVLGFRSLFFLVRKLRGAVKEGLENLVQFEGGANETNKQITALQSSLLFLKDAWAAAFAPVINVVVPILNAIIDKLAQVGNMIASFIAALTGQATVIHAVKTEVEDYAKSLDKSAGSSGKASKAADKLKDRLAAFDDLNVLGKDDETDPNSGAGGGGGIDSNLPNINDMFERVLTKSNFANMIKSAMEDWDFSLIGNMFSEKFVNAINKINWSKVQEKLSNGISGVTSFINGFFTNPKLFTSIGYNLAQGFNTAFGSLKEFIDKIDWYDIFHNVGSGVNTFLEIFDFSNITGLVESGIGAIISAFRGLNDSIDFTGIIARLTSFKDSLFSTWEDLNDAGAFTNIGDILATGIATAIDSVPLDDIETALNNLVTSICDFIDGVLDNEKLMNSIGGFIAGAFNSAANVVDNFVNKASLNKLASGLAKIVSTAITNMELNVPLKSLANVIKKLAVSLGVFLKDADWTEIGEVLAEAVVNGIVWLATDGFIKIQVALQAFSAQLVIAILKLLWGILGGIVKALSELVFNIFKSLDDTFKDAITNWVKTFKNAEGPLEIGKSIIDGILLGISAPLVSLGTWVKKHILDPFVDTIKDLFGIASPSKVMEELGNFIIEGLLLGISSMVSFVSEPFEKLVSNINDIFTNLKEDVQTAWTDIKTKITSTAESIKEAISTPFTDISDYIISTTTSLKDGVVALWSDIWDGIKGIINKIISGVESFCNAIIDGVNSMIGLLDKVNSLPDGVKDFINVDNFTVPKISHISIPRLAQGAVIPPNKEFMAILGDQKSGTNIEAPLDVIKEAFADVVGNLQVENTGTAVMQVDGQTFARLMTPYVVSELGRRGYDVKILGG